MTDTSKLEDQNPENKSKATGELKDGELERVNGGAVTENKEQAEAVRVFAQALQKPGQI